MAVAVVCYTAFIALHGAPALGAEIWAVPGSEFLLLIALGCAVLSVGAAIIYALRRKSAHAGRSALVGGIILVLAVPATYAAGRLRIAGFELAAKRAAPVVEAVRRYQAEHGRAPGSISDLQPKYLEQIPSGIPPLKILDARAADSYCEGNAWILKALVSGGLLNWDEFLYFEAQNYDSCRARLNYERVGDWIYHHE